MADAKQNSWYKATLPRRYIATIIDSVLLVILSIIFQAFFGWAGAIIFYVIAVIYPVFFVWKFGKTLGKHVMQIEVVTEDYKKVDLVQAFLREIIGKYISFLVLGLGYLWALWDKDWQGWHDKIAKTKVVTKIPNNGKHSIWVFILIGLGIITTILGILGAIAAIGIIALNPAGQFKAARTTKRLADMKAMYSLINAAEQLSSDPYVLCAGNLPPCEGRSDEEVSTNLNGTGWIKVDLIFQDIAKDTATISLPIDPVNEDPFIYRYCATSLGWEINATMATTGEELDKISPTLSRSFNIDVNKIVNDGGDDPEVWELGTNLTACSK